VRFESSSLDVWCHGLRVVLRLTFLRLRIRGSWGLWRVGGYRGAVSPCAIASYDLLGQVEIVWAPRYDRRPREVVGVGGCRRIGPLERSGPPRIGRRGLAFEKGPQHVA